MKKKFNFMIGEDLENNLIIYCKKKKISYNLCVNYIIELMLPLIKKIHFFSEEDNCKYQQIKATKKIRAYIKEDIYRELKLVHSNLIL